MKLSAKTLSSFLLLYAVGCASVTVEDPNGAGDGDGDGDGDGTPSTGGMVQGNTGGPVVIGDGDSTGGGLIGDGDGDATGGGLVGDGDGDGDVPTGGSSTGGGAATGGGSSTGGSTGNADCPTKTCGSGETQISGSMCFTITIGQYGGWMVNSNT